jgi:hypothetical protein
MIPALRQRGTVPDRFAMTIAKLSLCNSGVAAHTLDGKCRRREWKIEAGFIG